MSAECLGNDERRALLGLARKAIARRLKLDRPAPSTAAASGLTERNGCFVTLHKAGRLRGCIGRFTSDEPLPRTVEEMAEAAAFEDPRFPPLSKNELDEIDLEISVLTPMRRVARPDEVEVGRHGVYIIRGHCRGVLLPQVATENFWDRETFLEHTCLKAGLGRDLWKDPKTEIYVFSAEVFGEKEIG